MGIRLRTPNNLPRIRNHGFRARMQANSKIINRRRAIGRKRLAAI